jgi:hypothetical protein
MTDEQINEAIGAVLGWDCDPVEAREWRSRGQWVKHPEKTRDELWSKNMRLPRFVSDLNAMHEAERGDDVGISVNYYARLVSVAGPHPITATARQRAEAFLRTLGKWKES